jgi:hypothetical protein
MTELVLDIMRDLVGLDAAAEALGIQPRTIRDERWRRRVRLPVVRVGRRLVGVRVTDLRRTLRRERFA